MGWSFSKLATPALIAWSLAAVPACKKGNGAAATDLEEAGYGLTVEDWFRASRDDDPAAMGKFLKSGFAADSRNPQGDTALHEAAAAGALKAAEFLLNKRVPVDARGAGGRTPLMAAVVAKQAGMTRWLLRQGADPKLKDSAGFNPLMLAVSEGAAAPVAELAPYDREDLDSALLAAALLGRTEVVDELTNYGGSVYARMEDGRTPLMLAAENGHTETVKLLLDIGSSRLSVDTNGKTAAELATDAGHPEIAALITRDPQPAELALDNPEEVAAEMSAIVDAAAPPATAGGPEGDPADSGRSVSEGLQGSPVSPRGPGAPAPRAGQSAAGRGSAPRPLEGAVLAAVPPAPRAGSTNGEPSPPPRAPAPPLVMRYYLEKNVPIEVRSVDGDTARIRIIGNPGREVRVKEGETIPGSRLVVVRALRRIESEKMAGDRPATLAVVEVKDSTTGITREWASGTPASAHDPVALVEDAVSGRRYTAAPGQRFRTADGVEYVVTDVRPNQIVVEETATGAIQTLPLRGPRG